MNVFGKHIRLVIQDAWRPILYFALFPLSTTFFPKKLIKEMEFKISQIHQFSLVDFQQFQFMW